MTYIDHVGPKVLALSIEHKEVKTLQVSIEKTWDPISMDTKLGSFQPYFGGRCSQFDLRICCQMGWLVQPPSLVKRFKGWHHFPTSIFHCQGWYLSWDFMDAAA